MAVYTQLLLSDINNYCQAFELGQVTGIRGIEDGIENSTYFVDFQSASTTTHGVLTVFEYMSADQLPPFISLMTKLCDAGLQVPAPFFTSAGTAIIDINGKPGLLFPRAPGGHVSTPTQEQCEEIGVFLGRMHLTNDTAPVLNIDNSRGIEWQLATAKQISSALPDDERSLIKRQLDDTIENLASIQSLPSGIIHADLFHDNALFDEGRLSAVIDYYFACRDSFLLDLAIVANDWCWSTVKDGYDITKLEALIRGYQTQRQITSEEQQLWPLITRVAMTRFWLSRRKDEIEACGRRLKSAYPLRMRLEYLIEHPADLKTHC